jgi:Uncharacterized conserved protein (DUF2358)
MHVMSVMRNAEQGGSAQQTAAATAVLACWLAAAAVPGTALALPVAQLEQTRQSIEQDFEHGQYVREHVCYLGSPRLSHLLFLAAPQRHTSTSQPLLLLLLALSPQYVTGRLTRSLYDENCVFIDPTTNVKGVERYTQAVAALFDPSSSRADLISSEVVDDSTIRLRWRLEGRLKIGERLDLPLSCSVYPGVWVCVLTLTADGLWVCVLPLTADAHAAGDGVRSQLHAHCTTRTHVEMRMHMALHSALRQVDCPSSHTQALHCTAWTSAVA